MEKGSASVCKAGDTLCLDVGERSTLKNVRTGLIDPDTPASAMTKKSADGKEWKLVVSLDTLPSCLDLSLIIIVFG